jgi:hypothetical protein
VKVRYRVELSQSEREQLTALSRSKHEARRLKRAQILLAAGAGASDEEIARSVGVGGSTVYRTKRRFVIGNLDAALSEEPRPGVDRKLSGKEGSCWSPATRPAPRADARAGSISVQPIFSACNGLRKFRVSQWPACEFLSGRVRQFAQSL